MGVTSLVPDLNDEDDFLEPLLYADIESIDYDSFIEILDHGIPGKSGSTILNGFGPPAANLGRVDDFYFDRTGQRFYGPKDVSGWGLGFALGSGGGGSSNSVYQNIVETPDGTRVLFTVAQAYIPTTLNVYLNGLLLTPTVDFDETSPTSFTMQEAPSPGDIVRVHVNLA